MTSFFSPYHAPIFSEFFDIDIHAVSDFELNGKRIEIKETAPRKSSKHTMRISFTLKKKDYKSHDFFIFFEHEFREFMVCDAKLIDEILEKRNFVESTRINLSVIQKISKTFTKIEDVHEYIAEVTR